jgi:hypothetical protein
VTTETETQVPQPTQEELLGATTPEAIASLMAKYDGAPKEGVTETVEPPAPAAAEGAAPGTTPEQEQPAGIATKSGTGVLPYHVLQQSRDAERQARQRATTAEQERDDALQKLNALQGKAVPDELLTTAKDMTEAELNDLQYINPKAHRAVMLARDLAAPAATAAPTPTAAAPAAPAATQPAPQAEQTDEQLAAHDEAVAALNGRTLLSRLAQSGGAIWDKAIEFDAALRMDPTWAQKSMADRFAEVEQRIAKELGVSLPGGAQPSAPAPAPATAPAPKPEIQSFRPNTSSDLVSGAPPSAGDGISADADPMALMRRFSSMTNEQIQAQVRRSLGG